MGYGSRRVYHRANTGARRSSWVILGEEIIPFARVEGGDAVPTEIVHLSGVRPSRCRWSGLSDDDRGEQAAAGRQAPHRLFHCADHADVQEGDKVDRAWFSAVAAKSIAITRHPCVASPTGPQVAGHG